MSFDPAVTRQLLINNVFSHCSKDPTLVPEIIQVATEGVQAFARNQRDISSKMAFAMSDLMNKYPQCGSEHFSRTELLDLLNPCLDGTPWMKQQRAELEKTIHTNE